MSQWCRCQYADWEINPAYSSQGSPFTLDSYLFFFSPIQAIEIILHTVQKASVEFVTVTAFVRECGNFPVALLILAATLRCNPVASKLEASVSHGVVNQPDLIAEMLRSKITMRTPTIKLRSNWLHLVMLQKERGSSLAAGSGYKRCQDAVWSVGLFLRSYKMRRFI